MIFMYKSVLYFIEKDILKVKKLWGKNSYMSKRVQITYRRKWLQG